MGVLGVWVHVVMETEATLPTILKNTPRLPSHRFPGTKMASLYRISYLDVFINTAKLREGVSVVGWHHEGGTAYLVMFEMPDGKEVFFHYSERMLTHGLMKDIFKGNSGE